MGPSLQWRVFIADTKTGRVVRNWVPFAGMPQAGSRLNSEGPLSVTIPMSRDFDVSDVSEILTPWKFSVGFALGAHIAQYGPIVTQPEYDPEAETWQVTCGGIWKLFNDKRIACSQYGGDITYLGRSLHDIAIELVEDNLARDGGELPIDVPPHDWSGGHDRTYEKNKLVPLGRALSNLTDDIDGPEVEFRPYFPDGQAVDTVRYEMRVGAPNLGQLGFPHVFETRGALVVAYPGGDAARVADIYYVPGNGTGEQTPIGVATSRTLRDAGYTLLEDIDTSHPSTEMQDTLDRYAQQNLNTYPRASAGLRAVVRVDGRSINGDASGSPAIAELRNGDTGVFRLCGYIGVQAGAYKCRILGQSPVTPENLELQLQVLEVIPDDRPDPGATWSA